MKTCRSITALQRRLNAEAYDLLCEEIAKLDADRDRLQAENDDLRRQLAWAEDAADMWRDAITQTAAETGSALGLTCSGHVLVIPPSNASTSSHLAA